MALRRWKPFFPAFGAIDTAIEATTGACSRDKYRQARSELVEMLCDCDAADSHDDARAEGLCRLLDTAMVEALLTLQAVPVTPSMLKTADVDMAVGGLLRHEAGKVRALASGVLAEWKASIEAQGAALDTQLQKLRELAAPITGGGVRSGPEMTVLQADNKQAAKISDECPKNEQTETGDAKRKHPGLGAGGCFREDGDLKRRRKVPEIVVEHRPRKMEPAMKSRSRVSSWRSTDERRFSTSTRRRTRV